MQKATRAWLGGAKRTRSSSSSFSLVATAPGSGPRTHVPFLLNVVRVAQGMPSTAGSASPYRTYPSLPAGATKQAEGSATLFKDEVCVVVNDAFPKSFVHCLVLPLDLSLRSLNDLRYTAPPAGAGKRPTASPSLSPSAGQDAPLSNGLNHLELLQHMDTTAHSYVSFLRKSNPTLYGKRRFITGFHALPSLPMLHMHLVSMDLDSPCLKTRKHYNSFATFFFLTADRVIDDLARNGRVTINQNVEELGRMENQAMTCLWCGAPMTTIPAMKKHVPACSKNKSMLR